MPGKLAGLVIFCLLMCSNALSQDSLTYKTQHFIFIETGYSRHIVKDDVISPLLYKGSQVPILLNCNFLARKGLHSLSIYYDYLKLTSSITIKTPAEAFYAKNYNAFIHYSYCRKLYTFAKWKTSVFAGGEIKCLLNLRDHYYNNYVHYNSGEFTSNLGFSLLMIKKFTKSKNDCLSFRYNMSIIAYDMLNYLYNANVPKALSTETSQNTTGDLMKSNKPVTINKYFEFQTEISYMKFLNKFIGVELKHYLQYYHMEKFNYLLYTKYVNNQYLIGFIVKI